MPERPKILLTEDDHNLGTLLAEYLELKGYSVNLCIHGKAGFIAFQKEPFDICILDVMMPQKDGFTLAKEIRSINSKIPIIFLTAKSLKEDKIEGFNLGADDYITKPFSMEELLLRIKAILRRVHNGNQMTASIKQFKIGKFMLDSKEQTLTFGKKIQHLTTKESELLKMLCMNLNEVSKRDMLLKTIWLNDGYFAARSMDVFITKLRKLLEADPNVEIINIHGIGFKLIVK